MNNGVRKSLIDLKLMRIIHNEKQYLYILKVPSKNHLLITRKVITILKKLADIL